MFGSANDGRGGRSKVSFYLLDGDLLNQLERVLNKGSLFVVAFSLVDKVVVAEVDHLLALENLVYLLRPLRVGLGVNYFSLAC